MTIFIKRNKVQKLLPKLTSSYVKTPRTMPRPVAPSVRWVRNSPNDIRNLPRSICSRQSCMSTMLILSLIVHILSCMKICTLIRFSLKIMIYVGWKVDSGRLRSFNQGSCVLPSSVHRIFPKFGSESSKHFVDRIEATPLWDFIISDPIPSR